MKVLGQGNVRSDFFLFRFYIEVLECVNNFDCFIMIFINFTHANVMQIP